MGQYIVRRVLLTLVTMVLFSLILFFLVRLLPGDAALMKTAGDSTTPVNPAAITALRKQFGLDKPLPVQYANWVVSVAHGNFGRSFWTGDPASQALLTDMPVTVELVALSVVFSVIIGLLIGVISAVYRDRAVDQGLRLFALFGLSIPNFWVATILILLPAIWWHYLPPLGYISPFKDLPANLRQFLAPSAALGWALSASVMRITRSEMLEVLHQDYVRTAWAKGLQQRNVLLRHCLRNALIPVVTIVGLQLGFLLGGTVAVEAVYGLPGIGTLLLNGINQRDYPIIQAAVLVLALWFILINLTVDLVYALIDPRISLT